VNNCSYSGHLLIGFFRLVAFSARIFRLGWDGGLDSGVLSKPFRAFVDMIGVGEDGMCCICIAWCS
jgi:hypothetical protein